MLLVILLSLHLQNRKLQVLYIAANKDNAVTSFVCFTVKGWRIQSRKCDPHGCFWRLLCPLKSNFAKSVVLLPFLRFNVL